MMPTKPWPNKKPKGRINPMTGTSGADNVAKELIKQAQKYQGYTAMAYEEENDIDEQLKGIFTKWGI